MKLIRNSGNNRVIDRLREWLTAGSAIDFMTPTFSVHAFAETREFVDKADRCRLLLGDPNALSEALFGNAADISYRNRLQTRWLARLTADWINKRCEVRHAPSAPPQSLILVNAPNPRALLGTCSFTTGGLGITPGGQMGLVQATDTAEEATAFAEWFRSNWDGIRADPNAKQRLAEMLTQAASQRAPSLVYFQMLYQLFKDLGEELDEERIIKSATGIRDTVVWKKLYRFQRDGVIGAINKLERIGGCISGPPYRFR